MSHLPTAPFSITIKTLTGKNMVFADLESTTTFKELMERVQNREGIPPDQQYICYPGGRIKADENWMLTLGECGIRDGQVLNMILNLRGD